MRMHGAQEKPLSGEREVCGAEIEPQAPSIRRAYFLEVLGSGSVFTEFLFSAESVPTGESKQTNYCFESRRRFWRRRFSLGFS